MSDSPVEEFLRLLYAGAPPDAAVSLWAMPSKLSRHLPASDLHRVALAAYVADGNGGAGGSDVYFGVGLRRPGLPAESRGGKRDVVWLPALFLDLDVGTVGHKAPNCPPDLDAALEVLAALPEPSLVVGSGGGVHAYWTLTDPPSFAPGVAGDVDRARAASLLEDLQLVAIAAAERRGWHADKTASVDRVLRLPGTTNRKDAARLRRVELLASDGARYSFAELRRLVPADAGAAIAPPPKNPPAPAGERVAPPAGGGAGDVPRSNVLPLVGAGEPIDRVNRVRERVGKLRHEANRALMGKVLAGEAFAPPGRRDEEMQRVASILAFVDPDASVEELLSVLRASLDAMVAEAAAAGASTPTDEWAGDKIRRALEDAVAKRRQKEEDERDLRDALVVEALAPNAAPEAPGAGEPGAPPRPKVRKYDDAALAGFALAQGCSVEQFQRRWIIQRGPSFYVFVGGDYRPPISRDELEVSLPRDLAPAPVELTTYKNDGGVRRKKVGEILSDYATVARSLVADLALPRSYYDRRTQTFHEAVAPLRKLAPRFHDDVDVWLRCLAGPELAPKLFDWIATVTMLSRQSCALYLSGQPGAGKGMLAEGLARLWTVGAPTELARVLDAFNADLTRCPLIFADEHLPERFRGQRTSAELRQLVGSSGRTLSRKHLANADLRGAVRLILSANNDRLLSIGNEDLGAHDIEAVAGRFLHLPVHPSARAFLHSIGGRRGTDSWVDGDAIAEHALHLRDHWQVTPGSRFLVEGTTTKMHRLLATQGKFSGLVCEWLARYLDDPKPSVAQGGRVRVGGGEMLVNTSAIVEFWDVYVASDKVPTTTLLGRVLGNLSSGKPRVVGEDPDRHRCHVVDVELVLGWAEENQVGDVEKMRAFVDRTGVPSGVGAEASDA